MKAVGRFLTLLSVLFFLLALVSAWRVVTADAGELWYVPLVSACASAVSIIGALRTDTPKKVGHE